MRRLLTFAGLSAAATVVALSAYIALTLPPRSTALPPLPPGIVYGAYHVHSSRSDGSGSIDEIAAAAARAGLTFVILTDHGDGTRPPDPPAYRHGVLCVDAVEISSVGGHVVALNLPGAADYPLGGEMLDVIEDIHRMGGWAVAAHPDSPRAELRWRAAMSDFDGIEWLNVDSEWRDEPPARLLGSLGRALVRPAGTIAALFSRPDRSLTRWDTAARARPVVGLAAADAHARIDWRGEAEPTGTRGWAFPSYDAVFRSVAQAAILEQPLTGSAAEDAGRVLGAIGGGRTYAVIRAFADPGLLEFTAERNGVSAGIGASIDHGPVAWHAATPGAPAATLTLLKDGRAVATGQGSVTARTSEPGVFRVEAGYPGFAFPWIVSNPIRVGLGGKAATQTPPPKPMPARRMALGPETSWTVEKDSSSTATVSVDPDGVRLAFHLGPGRPSGQYTALATSASGEQPVERIRFTGRADRPMRISVQVRMLGGPDGRRWRRSVYLDGTPRLIDLALSELEPVGTTTALRPIVARVQSLLIVVDTVNTAPGAAGTVWISGVVFGLGDPQQP